MKRIYQRLKTNPSPFGITTKIFLAGAVTFIAAIPAAFSQELVFKNPSLIGGIAGQDNALYLFPGVTSTIDAHVKIKDRSARSVIMRNIDVTEFGSDKAFQPQIAMNGDVTGVQDWWIEFEILFVKAGTADQAEVREFNLTSLDVDGDGVTIREYVEIDNASGYYFEGGTELVNALMYENADDANKKNYRFLGPVKNYVDIDTAATGVMVTSKFVDKNKIRLRIGAYSEGVTPTHAVMRCSSFWFRSFNYIPGTFLPVKLLSFTAKAMNNDKVFLNWNTSQEKNSSHFTIEKSLNGKDFSDAGIVFSIGDSELPQQYSFVDKLRAGEKGFIHYRLKMVDVDQKSQHSPIKVVRIGDEKEAISILVYPTR